MPVRPANVVHRVTKVFCVELERSLVVAKAEERHEVGI